MGQILAILTCLCDELYSTIPMLLIDWGKYLRLMSLNPYPIKKIDKLQCIQPDTTTDDDLRGIHPNDHRKNVYDLRQCGDDCR